MVSNIVAVNDMDQNVAGAITYWRMSGPTSYTKLVEAVRLLLPGIKPPAPTSPEKALRRAVIDLKERRRIVSPLGAEGGGGWGIVEQRAAHGTLFHDVTCTVKLAPPNMLGKLVAVDPVDHHLAPKVEAGFLTYLDQMGHGDLSSWLVKISSHFAAVALRDTGGIYFMPKDNMPAWRVLRDAVKEGGPGHEIFTIPALKTSDAVDAVIDALQHETVQVLEALQEEIASGELGKRALYGRTEKCKSLLMKVRQYDTLLEQNQEKLAKRIEDMQAELVAAALAAEEDDKEAA